MSLDDFKGMRLSRRNAIRAGFGGLVAAQLALLEHTALTPTRASAATAGPSSNIQFDIGNFIAAPATLNDGAGNVTAQFGPVFSYFVPATLSRPPTTAEQGRLYAASGTIEGVYDLSPSGVFVFVSYGIPYFTMLPGGMNGRLVQEFMPQLRTGRNPDGTTRPAAEHACRGRIH